jgi:AraC family transcriptional regulator
MNAARIEAVFDGRLRPVHAGPPLLLSSQTPWNGLLVERDQCRAGTAESLMNVHTSLVLAESGPIEVEDRALAAQPRFVARSGSVTMWPAGHESRSIAWRPLPSDGEATTMIRVQLDLPTLQRLCADNETLMRRPLQPQPGADDVQLASMMRLMAGEIANGCPGGAMLGEYLCLALAAHVARRYGGAAPPRPVSGGLSRRQMDAVCALIDAELGSPLSLVQLAAVAGLGPSRFATAFRRSTGTTPHQYLLRCRIAKARALLARERMAVADVALALGFASQSHFTEVFRRLVGTTPRRYQEER